MTKIPICLLMTSSVILTSVSLEGQDKENVPRINQQEKQAVSKVRLSLNLKKGYTCWVAYDSEVSITQEGRGEGAGKWKVKADLVLSCIDVNENGIMTVSQSPSRICIEGTGIEGEQEVDFHSPAKNLQIPDLIRGHLLSLVVIKSVRIAGDGKIIAARQSPDRDDFDFIAMGKISYQDDPKWILPTGPGDAETVKFIASSVLGLLPVLMGKELTVGQTVTMKEPLPEATKGEVTSRWNLKGIQAGLAHIESKTDAEGESKVPNEFIDEVAYSHSLSKKLIEVSIETGVVTKCQGDMETEYRIMTLIPSLSSRVPTFSSTLKTTYTVKIIGQQDGL